MHPLFWDPEISRMHLHPQIQNPNAFLEMRLDQIGCAIYLVGKLKTATTISIFLGEDNFFEVKKFLY